MLYKLDKGEEFFHLESTRRDKVIYKNNYMWGNLHTSLNTKHDGNAKKRDFFFFFTGGQMRKDLIKKVILSLCPIGW